MSACDDYPLGNTHGEVPRWRAMCDEIDVLRAKRKADDLVFSAVNAECNELQAAYRSNLDLVLGLNDQIRELTKHADAMRDLLTRLDAASFGFHAYAANSAAAIEAYDAYIKEA